LADPLSETVEDLVDSFELFDDWEERYLYLIELGDELPAMQPVDHVDENKVDGCLSTVWLVARAVGDPPVMELSADSDSSLVKGLIAILLRVYSGRRAGEVLQFDIETLFERLDLKQNLSRSRSNGLRSMIRRIRQLAEQHQSDTSAA
jgi:cysteine desulfuration protein SufE